MKKKTGLTLFKQILKEAAKLYNRPEYAVTTIQFRVTSAGRMPNDWPAMVGGFQALKDYVAPAPAKTIDRDMAKMIERLLKRQDA